MARTREYHSIRAILPAFAVLTLITVAILAIFFVAPEERTMGPTQRIVYIHVAVAWCSLSGFLGMASAGLIYLVSRDLSWDHWAHASAELGWLCCTLTLLTGAFWARAAWGTWWTWDPRLTTTFVLWVMYAGCLLVRGGIEDPRKRARLCSVLAVLGAVDIPLVVMATRWFRGIHPGQPEMDPLMRGVLLACLLGFTAFFALLLVRRRNQIQLETAVASLNGDIASRQLESRI